MHHGLRFKFHHVGYATKNTLATSAFFENIGYKKTPNIIDANQKVTITLLRGSSGPLVELVQGLNPDDSPIENHISKNGVSTYHVCYAVTNISHAIDYMTKFGFRLLFNPIAAPAFDGRKICYLYSKNVGLIELLEENEVPSV
jgi:methylmalonyl-CoA/ethylmalonyl-CoA epimerase